MDRNESSQENPRSVDTASRRWCEILDVTPGAHQGELEQAYQRAISLIDGKSVGGYLMLDPSAAKSAREDVERAYAELKKSAPAAPPNAASERPSPQESASDVEGRYASGIPRRAMRILAPVTTEPEATPLVSASPLVRTRSLPKISIVAPVVDDVTAPDEADASLDTVPAQYEHASPDDGASPDDDNHGSAEIAADEIACSEDEHHTTEDALFGADHAPDEDELEGLFPAVASIPPEIAVGKVNVISPAAPIRVSSPDADFDGIRDGDEINGGLIRRLRETRGITIEALAKTTKVQRSVLIAIEEQDFAQLPARVYLRGFLTQIARVLKVDRKRLADGYLEFVERHGSRT